MRSILFVIICVLTLLGCKGAKEETVPAKTAAPSHTSTPMQAELVAAPAAQDPVDVVVKKELARAKADKRQLIVYVGASWCEPCKRFHNAVAAGEVDADFPTLRLLEFDRDRDEKRLENAGYTSRLIPLFVVPGPDGKATDKFIQGGVKGEGAVANIVPRLKGLLAR